MKLVKPTWVNHDGNPIFSIDIHPDDSRFATGGQGNDSIGRVVIWNMAPILKEEFDIPEIPKILCQLDHHNACVNCVRWSHSGSFLASGGDDKVIIIWRMTSKLNNVRMASAGASNCFGAPAYEIWKPVFTLRNHNGDVLDLSWAPHDKYLASASVDNSIIIWDGRTFQVIQELKDHTGLVKGVTWDPVGKYIASQSDDKSLKIWRTSDWSCEHTVKSCFKECGGTTHVLRLDWSPDGVYLVSAHAMNGGGPTAQIVERDGWKTDKDFVGHRKAVCCVRFTKTVIQIKDPKPVQTCYLALGSRDRNISIWSTALRRPVVVIRDAFNSTVMDISWSSCSTIMMACSRDGTAAIARFSQSELGVPLTQQEMANLQQKHYGKTLLNNSNLVPNLEVYLARKELEKKQLNVETPLTSPAPIPGRCSAVTQFQAPVNDSSLEGVIRGPDKQIETRTPDGKRRITPKFLVPPVAGAGAGALAPNFQMETSGELIFREQKEISTNSETSTLRDNMVSGIDELKISNDPTLPENPKGSASNDELILNGNGSGVGTKSLNKINLQPTNEIHTKDSSSPILQPQNGHGGTSTSSSDKEELNNNTNSTSPRGDLAAPASASSLPNGIAKDKETPTDSKIPSITPKINLIQVKRKREDSEDSKPNKIIRKSNPSQEIPRITLEEKQSSDSSPKIQTTPNPSQIQSRPPLPKSIAKHTPEEKRLPPMIIDDIFCTKVNKNERQYTLEVKNKGDINGLYLLSCQHEPSSCNGLQWSITTETPICGVVGDDSRIITLCDNGTVHILDTKGRYAMPPLVVPSKPSKCYLNHPQLMVITTSATVHIWNIQSKKCIIKTESLLPLLNQFQSQETLLDISHATVAASGVPLVILSNGKSFMYNFDMQTWMAVTDPATGHAFANINKRPEDMLRAEPLFTTLNDKVMKQQYSIITLVKLKLASATELRKSDDVRKWLLILAKTLARFDLQRELHQLCEDLLGPTHSSASSSPWSPLVGGVNKRGLLREILTGLLEDLRWQDFYCEFDDLLAQVQDS